MICLIRCLRQYAAMSDTGPEENHEIGGVQKMRKTVAAKNLALLLMMSLLLTAVTACGSSDSSDSTRSDKAGFDSETNQIIEVGGYSFEIPDYYVLNEENSGDDHTDYRAGDGEAVIRFATEKTSGTNTDFEEAYDTILDNLANGIADDAKRDGNYYTATVNGDPCSGKIEAFYNEKLNTLVYALFLQQDTSSTDYLPDWEKVLSSKKTIEAASGESDSSESDSGVLSPEFKKTMDDYEAWFDHYCEVMKKYNENPSDMELLSEMTDLIAEETKMLEQMENMDQSEMNKAELAYYIEVTARIEKKLLEVAY